MSVVPKNIITEDQYTRGGELFKLNTGEPYQGFYCIIGNKYYTGKTYLSTSVELIKRQPNSIANPPASFKGINSTNNTFGKRYFAKKLNVNPLLIREINVETYSKLNKDPLYQTVVLDGTQIFSGSKILDEAEKKMVGIKAFLLG